MKMITISIIWLLASALLACHVFAQENCNKNIMNYTPPSGTYEQISPKDARNMKNYIFPDQEEFSITLERVPEKTEDGNTEQRFVK